MCTCSHLRARHLATIALSFTWEILVELILETSTTSTCSCLYALFAGLIWIWDDDLILLGTLREAVDTQVIGSRLETILRSVLIVMIHYSAIGLWTVSDSTVKLEGCRLGHITIFDSLNSRWLTHFEALVNATNIDSFQLELFAFGLWKSRIQLGVRIRIWRREFFVQGWVCHQGDLVVAHVLYHS